MAVADLYGVTATLRNLVRFNIWRLTGLNIAVTDLPPEKADELGGSNLNLHLFHAVEDASKRNEFALDAMGDFPIKETPLPLVLYYVLTAHSLGDDPPDIPGQHRLMGLAMKTLHDFPSFTERLELPAPPLNALQPVFDTALRGDKNKIEIIPRQITPEESVNFWSAALNHTARLTAYYEVRSTLLPPDDIEERAGLVLSYGLGVIPGGRPRLDGASTVQTAVLPAALGGGILQTVLRPGEAAIGSSASPSAAQVTVTGTDVGDGTSETLVLTGADGEIEIDPTANPAWAVSFIAGTSFRFTVQPTAAVLRNGAVVNAPIVPGPYTAALRRRRPLTISGGPPRTATTQSNAVPLAIGASIAGISTLSGPPRLHIDLAPGVDATAVEDITEITIAGEVYRRHPPLPPSPLQTGEFAAVAPNRFEIMLNFDPADGDVRPIRLGIGGVDCAPAWIAP